MNYWMFTVMYEAFPELWPTLVQKGLAAQHCPPEWVNQARNIKALLQTRHGHAVIAALKNHRFAGYGFLTTDSFRGGEPLPIWQDGKQFEFRERAEIDWTVIPLDVARPYVKCSNLKDQGYDVDLTRGLCVKEVDEKTFAKVKEVLDSAGAKPQWKKPHPDAPKKFQAVRNYIEGEHILRQTEGPERDPAARRECIRGHGTNCSVCGLSFESEYGEIGIGYIEVHHLHPLGGSCGERIVDPKEDMCPICPNCHAMIHRKDPPFGIDELKNLYRGTKLPNKQQGTTRRRSGVSGSGRVSS